MSIALAQINPTVGDFEGNLALIREAAIGAEASLVVFPEFPVGLDHFVIFTSSLL